MQKKILHTKANSHGTITDYWLEEEEDLITKEEAIRRLENGEIAGAKVVRPGGSSPYIRTLADSDSANNLQEIALKKCCGPEINFLLNEALSRTAQAFYGWSSEEKIRRCNALLSPVSNFGTWDIFELNTSTRDTPRPFFYKLLKTLQNLIVALDVANLQLR